MQTGFGLASFRPSCVTCEHKHKHLIQLGTNIHAYAKAGHLAQFPLQILFWDSKFCLSKLCLLIKEWYAIQQCLLAFADLKAWTLDLKWSYNQVIVLVNAIQTHKTVTYRQVALTLHRLRMPGREPDDGILNTESVFKKQREMCKDMSLLLNMKVCSTAMGFSYICWLVKLRAYILLVRACKPFLASCQRWFTCVYVCLLLLLWSLFTVCIVYVFVLYMYYYILVIIYFLYPPGLTQHPLSERDPKL